ncbi:lysylphosphatidylglycerol synthase domain-containing protein [Mycobacterium decipiens]|nr:lysylphosphatidylglycerol synthase domain-containing protein [Mycobacterium decipiens]
MARSRWMNLARVAFLVAVALGGWWGFRGREDELWAELRNTSVAQLATALALTLVGLFITAVIWRTIMAGLGAELGLRDALSIFFVGQLGKYVPGSVWTVGAQAYLARRCDIPARVTAGAGLIFLGYNVATAVLVGGLACMAQAVDAPWPRAATVAGVVATLLALTPPVVRWLGKRLAGRTMRLGWTQSALLIGLMGCVWGLYALALLKLASSARHFWLLAGAFAISYAIGVVVVFAPAGLGAREAMFIVLTAPVIGAAPAAALALLARAVHTAADVSLAFGSWLIARGGSKPRVRS